MTMNDIVPFEDFNFQYAGTRLQPHLERIPDVPVLLYKNTPPQQRTGVPDTEYSSTSSIGYWGSSATL